MKTEHESFNLRPGLLQAIAHSLAIVGGTEFGAFVIEDDRQYPARVLVATNRGITDVQVARGRGPMSIKSSFTPWAVVRVGLDAEFEANLEASRLVTATLRVMPLDVNLERTRATQEAFDEFAPLVVEHAGRVA